MPRFDATCLRLVRWTGWLLIPTLLAFLLTGYCISGRFGFGRWLDETTALECHKLLHAPLILLTLVHSIPAIYLAMRRWGWIRSRPTP